MAKTCLLHRHFNKGSKIAFILDREAMMIQWISDKTRPKKSTREWPNKTPFRKHFFPHIYTGTSHPQIWVPVTDPNSAIFPWILKTNPKTFMAQQFLEGLFILLPAILEPNSNNFQDLHHLSSQYCETSIPKR